MREFTRRITWLRLEGRKVLVDRGRRFPRANLCQALAVPNSATSSLWMRSSPGAVPIRQILKGYRWNWCAPISAEIDLRPHCDGARHSSSSRPRPAIWAAKMIPSADMSTNAMAQIGLIAAVREVAPGNDIGSCIRPARFYGRAQYCPSAESHPVAPMDANGISKFAGEHIGCSSIGREACASSHYASRTATGPVCASAMRGRTF